MRRTDRPGVLDAAFSPRAVPWFLRIFGLAVIVDVLTELASGVWHVHTGELYPWRSLGFLPLYPARGLAIEWALRVLAGAAIVASPRRVRVIGPALRVLAAVLFVSCVERYSNHGALLFLVALFTSLAPPDVSRPDFEAAAHPALGLVRAQLVIVYGFSALNKLTHGFANGESLTNLLATRTTLAGIARPLSWAVLAVEIALPFVVIRYPRPGLVGVVLVHLGFALVVPGVWSFGLVMIAMALLWSPAVTSRAERSAS